MALQVNDQTALAIIKGSSKGAEKVELKLDKPIPKELIGKVIKAKISDIKKDGSVKLTMQNGKTLTGKLAEPLPKGTELVFTVKAEGDAKVIKLEIPENKNHQTKQNNNNQQKGENNTKNNTTGDNKSNTQTAKQNVITAKTVAETTRNPVKIQAIDNKPLPMTSAPKTDATVKTQANKNGFSQIVLANKQQTKINIKLPQNVPIGTRLAIKIISLNEAKVLDVKPPSSNTNQQNIKIQTVEGKPLPSNISNKFNIEVTSKPNQNGISQATIQNKQETKINIQLPKNTVEGTKLTVDTTKPNNIKITGQSPQVVTTKPVISEIATIKPIPVKINFGSNVSIVTQSKNNPEQLVPLKNITTVDSKILQQIKIDIPSSAKVDKASNIIKLIPNTTVDLIVMGKDLLANKITKPDLQQAIKIPLNTEVNGKIESLPTITGRMLFTLKLPQGVNFNVNSSLPIAQGATMAIRFTPDGISEVLRIVEPQPVTGDDGKHGKKQHGAQTYLQTDKNGKLLKVATGTKFSAIVSSKSVGGVQTLTMPNGQTFQASTAKRLPVGAEVSVKIMANGEATIVGLNLPSANAKTEALLQFSRKWGALTKALNELKESHPSVAKKIEGQIPNPASKAMLPALLQFAEAVTNHNKTKFLGNETLNLLKSLGIDFTADLNQLNQLQQKPDAPDGWRAFYFPFLNGEDTDQAGFYWRNKENDGEDKSTRFVVNLSLSELGPVQIDGLMQDKHMMLKIRLHSLPSPDFEDKVNEIVQKALEPLEIQGKVSVEISQTFETDPLHDILEQENHTGLVV